MNSQNVLPVRFKQIDICTDNINSIDYCYTSKHDYCIIIIQKIKEFIKLKKNIPEKLIERYIKVIGNAIECWSLNYIENIKIAEYIFDNYDFNEIILRSLFLTENSEMIIIFFEKKINKNSIQPILDIIYKYNINIGNLFDILCDKIINIYNQNDIEKLFDYAVKIKNINLINKLLDSKFKPSNDSFINLISKINLECDEPINIIKKCIFNGIKIEKNFIQLYVNCIQLNFDYYDRISSFYDIITYLYDNGADIKLHDIITCKEIVLQYVFNNTINYISNSDYNITKDDFLLLCKKKIQIKDYKKIKDYFDDKDIQFAIFESGLNYPIKINFTLDILRIECKKRNNFKQIQEICKTIKPDIKCLEYACVVPNNTNVIKFLHEKHKIPFNELCIINFASIVKQNLLLRYIVNKYKKDNNIDVIVTTNINHNSDDDVNSDD